METYVLLKVAGAVLLALGAVLAIAAVWAAKRLQVRRVKADLAGLERFEAGAGAVRARMTGPPKPAAVAGGSAAPDVAGPDGEAEQRTEVEGLTRVV